MAIISRCLDLQRTVAEVHLRNPVPKPPVFLCGRYCDPSSDLTHPGTATVAFCPFVRLMNGSSAGAMSLTASPWIHRVQEGVDRPPPMIVYVDMLIVRQSSPFALSN